MEEGKMERPPRAPNATRPRISVVSLLLYIWQCVKALVLYVRDTEALLRKSVVSLGEKGLSDTEKRKFKQSKLKQSRASRLGYLLFLFTAVGLLAFISQDSSLHRVEKEFELAIVTQANIERGLDLSLNRKIKFAGEANRLVSEDEAGEALKISEVLEEELRARWPQESAHVSSLRRRAAVGTLRVGLLNMQPTTDLGEWKFLTGKHPITVPQLRVADTVNWIHLFPEWIDEEALYGYPKCPVYPMPNIPPVPYVSEAVHLDVVIARAPCAESSTLQEAWKDPALLQVLLGAANLASETGRESIFVLILSKCRPLVNLFPCGELLEHREEGWLFHMNVENLKKRTSLPVGTCQLSIQLSKYYERPENTVDTAASQVAQQREAYVTMLHSSPEFVCGAIATAQSIRQTGSTKDLLILVDSSISSENRQGLAEAGWKVQEYEKIQDPGTQKDFSMIRLWQLDYDKVIFLESDVIVLRDIDHLFRLPEVSACGTTQSVFYNGLMVIEPSNCTFNILMDEMEKLASIVIDEWDFFNRVFPWWHRIPRYMNTLKFYWSREKKQLDYMNRLFSSDPSELHAIHYVRGQKPWKCYRDYDCNWNTDDHYASDEAHAKWFELYDHMPEKLQQYCALSASAISDLERHRAEAQSNDLQDKHWLINITDPRSNVCQGEDHHCDWEQCQRVHCDWNAMAQVKSTVNSTVDVNPSPEHIESTVSANTTTTTTTSATDSVVASVK